MAYRFPIFLDESADTVARRLLGCELVREIDGHEVRVKIVETESYDQTDAASHSYKGKTPRTEVMFGPSGYLYVYFTYGMHYCCNVVTGPEGEGSAVLIRAVEPISGTEIIERRRGREGVEATNGPAKLCQALGIDKQMNGHDLHELPLRLEIGKHYKDSEIIRTTRIGIATAKDELRRYYIKDNPYVSHARR
jgi:DNA-3-methyladenine glycosylase